MKSEEAIKQMLFILTELEPVGNHWGHQAERLTRVEILRWVIAPESPLSASPDGPKDAISVSKKNDEITD